MSPQLRETSALWILASGIFYSRYAFAHDGRVPKDVPRSMHQARMAAEAEAAETMGSLSGGLDPGRLVR